jgi:hypothetical protein
MISEPRLLLLGGSRGSWSAKDRQGEAATMNGIEAWVYAFNGDYAEGPAAKQDQLKGYDIIIANTNNPHDHLLRLAQNRSANTKWVTLIEGDALDYLKPQPYIRELMECSDLVGCINKYSEAFFKSFTSTRAQYIGIPYPAEGIRSLATPFEKRRKEIFLAPMMLSRWTEYFCAKDNGIPLYGYERRLTRQRRTILKTLRKHRSMDPWHFHKKARMLYHEPEFTIYRDEPLPEFFRRNGGAYLWLNLDERYTWGRYVLDAAALQIPIIATRSTGHAEHFFPGTMVENEFDVDKARQLITALLQDEEFYRSVSEVPIEKFEHLQPGRKKKELLDILYPS